MIREIACPEFGRLYRERIREDFPLLERRPLASCRTLFRRRQYRCFVLEKSGVRAAYAAFIDLGGRFVFLEYLAVAPQMRSSGVGSAFLPQLAAQFPGRTLMWECEAPDAARSPAEREKRERRIAFYERLGARRIPQRWKLMGGEFELLRLPGGSEPADSALVDELENVYRSTFPAGLGGRIAHRK